MIAKFPYTENGTRSFINDAGQRVCTGAMMGRCDSIPADAATVAKLHLRRVPFVSGDYDQGGAYWGGGRGTLPLFCAWGESATEQAVAYFRAIDRAHARAQALTHFPNAKFFR